jgi:uncharacterized protein (TIGR02646 family)
VINRTRPPTPKSLSNNAARWTRELLAQVKKASRKKGKSVPDEFFDRYNKKDVKVALAEMYANLCCYCDSRIGIVDFPHIEHRKPKRRFHRSAFKWDNLHLACTQCNVAKGIQWNTTHPILDAVVDKPVSDYLEFDLAYCVDKKPRGRTTIDHANLNRVPLLEAREKILETSLRLIQKINLDPQHTRALVLKRQLDKLSADQYGSFIEHIKKSFLQ